MPRPGGGDLQLTPLSPASSYMGFKNEVRTLTRENRNKQVVRRGWWARQSISAKPQNISGAIGGPRERFLVSAPPQLSRRQAEIYRYARGGRFPKFDDSGVVEALLSYMQNVEKGVYALRMTIDRQADGIIEAALDFIDETMAAARDVATGFGVTTLPDPPTPQDLIFRMTYWGDRQAAVRQALTGRHFMNRASQILARRS
ncbi:MAG: hypothetical protein B7Z62_08085 [Deltaproteobacteria bacterium 37-65-8]|nr:MAG: hypothetical protein B7Z62_08085 [Deltaproteobacteria bacterium 37-65-8]